MRVLMLNYEFPPIGGGAANANLCLLQEYAKRSDIQVDMLTSAPEPGFHKEQLSGNITVTRIGIRKPHLHHWKRSEVISWLLRAGFYYRRMLGENRYDLAHAFFGFPTGWLCYRQVERLPYIISLRGSDVPGDNARLKLDYKILAPVFRAIWSKAALLVACSEGLRSRALRFMPDAGIDVIPNGVDLNRFRASQDKSHTGPLRLLTAGRLSVTKRVDMLIDAVAMLHKSGLDVRLTVVGGGKLEPQLRHMASNKGAARIVKIVGRVHSEKMPKIYQGNNIFVSASMQEGMSNAMLEAMASGLPIITSACEGTEELVKDNGVRIEEATAKSIAGAIRKLWNDRDAFRQMSAKARQQAAEFGWDKIAESYIETYRKVLN